MMTTKASGRSKSKSKMAKTDAIFLAILVWSMVSTALLVRQFQSNTELQRQLSVNTNREQQRLAKEKKMANLEAKYRDSKKFMGKRPKAMTMTANKFPFTRSLHKFERSRNFFIYVVQSASQSISGSGGDSDVDISATSSSLEWSEVRWGDLVANWGRNTTFENLLHMSTPLTDNGKTGSGEDAIQKKIVLHCLPKAASTTLRTACNENMRKNCKAIEIPRQQDPFGYRKIDDFFRAVKECKDIDHFCVQGGDAEMSIINYDNTTVEENANHDRDPVHFVHMVPFRNYDDWVESAIKQIWFIDGQCDRVNQMLDQCLGYRELYMELYPKSVLSLLTGMAFDANSKGLSSKDVHHILLYNYKEVDTIVTEVSDIFGLDPRPLRTDRRHKERRNEGTCPGVISEKFHECHDETLIKSDAIRGLAAEKIRRTKNDRALKYTLNCFAKGTCEKCIESGKCTKKGLGGKSAEVSEK